MCIYRYINVHSTHTHIYIYIYIHTYIYIFNAVKLIDIIKYFKKGEGCTHFCEIQYTLTGHFIRYTFLVPGWPSFAFRTALILHGIDSTKFCKHSLEILVHIDMIASRSCCRFVGCTSMMWISLSTTSQRCSIGLRSGDCGGHLSKVNSLSCSRNQSEMIWALWHGALSCWN